MNERIGQLAEQADIYINESNCAESGNGTEIIDWHIEKFAELIIAECAQACINMGNDYEVKSAGQYQAELFAFAIKQHFGVKE